MTGAGESRSCVANSGTRSQVRLDQIDPVPDSGGSDVGVDPQLPSMFVRTFRYPCSCAHRFNGIVASSSTIGTA